MTPTLTRDDVASPDYRSTLRKRYESPGWGASGYGHAQTVVDFAGEIGAGSVLDYGCGRGTLKRALGERGSDLDVREYDPGIVGKDALPEPADLLVSTDVLEHIEPALLDNVLAHLAGLARRGLYLNIALSRAKETLPDGRNAHLIVQPAGWWVRRLGEAGLSPHLMVARKGVGLWIKR